MSTPTYDLIETTTLTSAASSVTFSSITQDYRDFIIVCDVAATAFDSWLGLRFNSDTGSNYNYVNTSGTSSRSGSNDTQIEITGNVNTDNATYIIQALDYSATDKHKSVLARGGSSTFSVGMTAGRWANTNAITSATVFGGQGITLEAGSTFSLYGISA